MQIAIAANSDGNAQATAINAFSSQTGVTAVNNSGTLALYSTAFGSGHTISLSLSAGSTDSTGLVAGTSTDGADIQGTIDGSTAVGVGNTLYATSGPASGLTVTVATNATGTYANTTQTDGTTIEVNANNALLFQIGANSGQSATLTIQAMTSDNLGLNASGNTSLTMLSLAQINVMDPLNAANVLAIVDKAIGDVSSLAGTLGAFQNNTLQATAANLQTSLQNTTAANSTIRDTNFATETATYTQQQVLVQAGTQVLKNANQLPQLALSLLQ